MPNTTNTITTNPKLNATTDYRPPLNANLNESLDTNWDIIMRVESKILSINK